MSDEEQIVVLIGLAAVAFVMWKFPEWIRAAKEDQERWAEYARERMRAYDYKNIPARLDKWQQERNGVATD